jgi:8-oxo-dGTP pyrophosphatase MutT (NUDIX family)
MSEGSSDEPINDASTIIVLRDTDAGIETFMLCRHQQSGFMGGAHVFPGGKVDAEDRSTGWLDHVDQTAEAVTRALGERDEGGGLALLIAGIRETFEEAGVLLARTSKAADLVKARTRLHEGEGFMALAKEVQMRIDANALVPYARWVTPKMESRRFDTRFYIARMPEDQEASHDGSETTSAVWLRPSEALDGMLSGRLKLAPPTVRTLRWLAEFEDSGAVMQDARSRTPPLVRPRIVTGEGTWFLALPGDAEHPENEPVLPGATRMIFDRGAWRDAP